MDAIPRLSPVETEILSLLITHREMYGLEMVAASTLLKRGTVYVTLGRMADKGLVESHTVKPDHEPGLPRRLFRATGLGQQAFTLAQFTQSFMQQVTA